MKYNIQLDNTEVVTLIASLNVIVKNTQEEGLRNDIIGLAAKIKDQWKDQRKKATT